MGSMKTKTLIVLVIVTAVFVFLLPVEHLTSCQCNNNALDTGLDQQQHRPNFQQALGKKDIIVYGSTDLNDTLNQYKLFHQGDLVREVKHTSNDLRKKGWVLDCITWENKWETTSSDMQTHDFLLDVYHLGDGEDHDKRQNIFEEIFHKKDWPATDPSYHGLQSSGPGAMLKHAQGIIAALNVIITKIKQHLGKSRITMLDLPCGDLQWISRFLITRNDILYTGADIVPELISYHKKTFDRLPRTRFIQHDIVKTPLNESYDLILSRDLLQHLWKVDAVKALDHISASKSSYLLVTTYPGNTENKEVEKDALGSRKSPYNLELPPFLLDSPICMSYDWNVEHMGLWPLPLKQKLEAS